MLLNRESLKNLFRKGKFPSENHFAHLIDSSINKVEDGISKSPESGLQLSPQSDYDQLISIFERLDMPHAAWQIKLLRNENSKGLSFDKVELNEDNEEVSESRLFLGDNGKIGFHTATPWAPVEVNSTLGMKGRVGTFAYGQVPGDGKWHHITTELTGVQALEVVARIDGPKGRGKYAVTHAIALSTFGGRQSHHRIRQTRAYYGWFLNRIELKWEGEITAYRLKVRTRQNYGPNPDGGTPFIKFHVTKLWDDALFASDDLPSPEPILKDTESPK